MTITQDVITDLLPAYLSGEASADTQALVDEFQREHPQFAAIVQAARRGLGEPLAADQRAIAPDLEREVVRRTRAVISRQRLMLAFAIVLTLMPLSLSPRISAASSIPLCVRPSRPTATVRAPSPCALAP